MISVVRRCALLRFTYFLISRRYLRPQSVCCCNEMLCLARSDADIRDPTSFARAYMSLGESKAAIRNVT